jgi:NAD(P)-dependent dehydrogenase (short-subunit alcohol dehydrogenase family)
MTETTVRDLEGKTALVTGATSGIGRAIVRQLAVQGATVLVHGRDAGRAVQVIEEVELSGAHARFVSADLETRLRASDSLRMPARSTSSSTTRASLGSGRRAISTLRRSTACSRAMYRLRSC